MRAYLEARQVPASRVQPLITQCTRAGLLNDALCAKLWATTWREHGYALAAIQARLQERGIPDEMIRPVLAALRAEVDDAQKAAELVQVMGGRRSPQRLSRWLASRGFDDAVIEDVIA